MSAFEFCARYDFHTRCVTHNKGTQYQMTTSMHDIYSHSLNELLDVDIHKVEGVNLSSVHRYKRVIWRHDSSSNIWLKICEDTFYNKRS